MSEPKRTCNFCGAKLQVSDYSDGLHDCASFLKAERDRLKAENARLREAVKMWEEDSDVLPEDRSITETVTTLRSKIELLREALAWKMTKEFIGNCPYSDPVFETGTAKYIFGLLKEALDE